MQKSKLSQQRVQADMTCLRRITTKPHWPIVWQNSIFQRTTEQNWKWNQKNFWWSKSSNQDASELSTKPMNSSTSWPPCEETKREKAELKSTHYSKKLRSSVFNKKLDKKEQELEIHLRNCRKISTIGRARTSSQPWFLVLQSLTGNNRAWRWTGNPKAETRGT